MSLGQLVDITHQMYQPITKKTTMRIAIVLLCIFAVAFAGNICTSPSPQSFDSYGPETELLEEEEEVANFDTEDAETELFSGTSVIAANTRFATAALFTRFITPSSTLSKYAYLNPQRSFVLPAGLTVIEFLPPSGFVQDPVTGKCVTTCDWWQNEESENPSKQVCVECNKRYLKFNPDSTGKCPTSIDEVAVTDRNNARAVCRQSGECTCSTKPLSLLSFMALQPAMACRYIPINVFPAYASLTPSITTQATFNTFQNDITSSFSNGQISSSALQSTNFYRTFRFTTYSLASYRTSFASLRNINIGRSIARFE